MLGCRDQLLWRFFSIMAVNFGSGAASIYLTTRGEQVSDPITSETARSVKSNRNLSFFPTEGYSLQQPLLQLFSSVAFVATAVLSAQQPAL